MRNGPCNRHDAMNARLNLASAQEHGRAAPEPGGRILAFPRAGNLYPEILYREVEAQGATVIEGTWTTRWILENLLPVDLIHIHWPSFL